MKRIPRYCRSCGHLFAANNGNAYYCTQACYMRAYRARRMLRESSPAEALR